MTTASFDLAIVGAGILGLAHALAASRLGKRVVVIDRDTRANGASVRNFGFVTVTGQQAGDCWTRAMRTRDIWAEIAPKAGIEILQRGLLVVARRPEARHVLESVLTTEMGAACKLIEPRDLGRFGTNLKTDGLAGALYSPHELRVESREAIPRLAGWLAEQGGVTFLRDTAVHAVTPPRLETSRGLVMAEKVVVCPGDDFHSLLADRLTSYGLTRCKLHMMRVSPDSFDPRLPPIMSDLGLVRYLGYAERPEAAALRTRIAAEQGEHLANGIHLIVVRGADGSLVIGDSHHYDTTPDPFAPTHIDQLILDEYGAVFTGPPPKIIERWIGTYASAHNRLALIDRPAEDLRIVIVTSGTGASTAFALAEDVIAEFYG